MLKKQKGFTLIELVIIIVILGILAAVAIPRYIDLQADAEAANNMAYIGTFRSAISMRFAQQLLRGGAPDVIGSTAVEAPATIADIVALIAAPSAVPSSLTVTAGACGVGTLVGSGKLPGSAPVTVTWTLTCGTTATDPISLVSAPAGY